MPYSSIAELGKGKDALPDDAKTLYMTTFNEAYDQHKSGSRAEARAWGAVKQKYRKDDKGAWIARNENDATDSIDHMEAMVMDGMSLTSDGYLVAAPRVARTGIQLYKGLEMGLGDDTVIRVYRPEGEVFDVDAIKSLAYRPVTLGHPPEMVDAKNWKKWAVGFLGGDFARDGQFIRFPMAIMDGRAVKSVRDGLAKISVGYTSDIKWDGGTTPDGEQFDATQTSIRANHVAIVDRARGGAMLRLGDLDLPDSVKEHSKEFMEACREYKDANPNATEQECVAAGVKQLAPPHKEPPPRITGKIQFTPDRGDDIASKHRSKHMSDLMRSIVVDGVSIEVPEDLRASRATCHHRPRRCQQGSSYSG